jgi:nitrilase
MIIDPWGNILARLEQGPGFAYADVDLAWQKVLRNDFPALNHRKLDYINV